MTEPKQAKGRVLVGGLAVALLISAQAGCARTATEVPSDVADAVAARQLDARALQNCTMSGGEPIAAIDSSGSQVRGWGRTLALSPGYEKGLPGDEQYVAICVYDADSISGLAEGLQYFAGWQATGVGSGALLAW